MDRRLCDIMLTRALCLIRMFVSCDVQDARSALDDLGDKSKTGMQFYLANGAGSFIDEISQVYDLLPVMIVVTLIVVFILNAINFRSA